MAWPFGKHPTLAEYITWARDNHGFRAQTGVCPDEYGKSVTFTKISKDGGPSVIVSGESQYGHLFPSTVGYLNRRLGLTYPLTDSPERPPQKRS